LAEAFDFFEPLVYVRVDYSLTLPEDQIYYWFHQVYRYLY